VVVLLKKIISILLILIIPMSFPLFASADAQPQLSAKSAVLMNADNGEILYAKGENDKRPMASTTKIMTALITLETAAVNNRIVTITDNMVRVEGSSMGLMPGNKLSLKSLAAGMLLVSGNDAANSAAIAIGGSTKAFAELMNKRAKELNMTDTHFVTPSGLDDEEHYTTARDLAVLAAAAMKNPDFAEIACEKSMSVQFISPDQTRRLTNHNKLLSMYSGCVGVKTGFTKKAGRCLVSSAEKNGVHLVAVTLNASDDWNDHEKMLNYGFSKLISCPVDDSGYSVTFPVVGGTSNNVVIHGSVQNSIVVNIDEAPNIKRTVELPAFVYAPVEAGQVLGTVRYTVGSKTVATTELIAVGQVAKLEIPKNIFEIFLDHIKNLFI
jgi:D-alanyl-D-alanine carboxypeptidase/D-alanyl-D-alanine carboxypeptidase (penicillin-binding protein 5/6)